MSRKEGEPVRFVVTKRFEFNNKVLWAESFHDWDRLTVDTLIALYPDCILEMSDKNPEEELKNNQQESLDYEGRVEYMPIRFVVTKDFSYRGEDYKKEDIVDWPPITYEEFVRDKTNKNLTKIIKMDTTDWIKDLTKEVEKLKEDVSIIIELLQSEQIDTSSFSVLEKEKIDGNGLGGLVRDYADIKDVKQKVYGKKRRSN